MLPLFLRGVLLAMLLSFVPVFAQAAPFALPDGRSLPNIDFDRHVHALLNRQGCNAGACHGGRQGKGGFSLSLFSGSPTRDFEEIWSSRGRRIDIGQPDGSLLLLKATGRRGHAGGRRLTENSWEYRLLRQWIQEGAQRQANGGDIVQLKVIPSEHFFAGPQVSESSAMAGALLAGPNAALQLRVVAEFVGGACEDVTPFTDFRTPEPEVVEVTPQGQVRALRPGFAPVLAFYRNRVAPMTAMVPWPALKGADVPEVLAVNFIDRELFAHMRKLKVPASELSSDSEFLRRVHIDVTGSLPTPDEVRQFLASKDPLKRQKKIDQLLSHPWHADLWARRFTQITGLTPGGLRLTGSADPRWEQMAHDWFRRRVVDNVPVDRICRDVLLATSREQLSAAAWIDQVRRFERADPFASGYSQRGTLDLFWHWARLPKPSANPDVFGSPQTNESSHYLDEIADHVASAFLGVSLECARCHHHPVDDWSSADRRAFANVFAQVQVGVSPEAKAPGKKSVPEVIVTPGQPALQRKHPDTNALVTARILGGPAVSFKADARAELFDWLTTGERPLLARVFVNRVWRHYFGRGLVPGDLFVAANPPTHPGLLDALTRDFVAGGYDLRRLERTMLMSRAYQLSAAVVPGNANDRWFASHSMTRRTVFPINADLLADALGGHASLFPDLPSGRRFVEVASATSVAGFPPARDDDEGNEALDRLFGRKELMSRCRQDSWLSSLSMYGGQEFFTKSKRLKALLAGKATVEAMTDELFLALLTRFPTAAEMQRVREHVERADADRHATRQRRWEDVVWALINTNEFLVRR